MTALVMGIAGGNEKESLSDAEIRERALELGMVDSSNLVLSDLVNTAQPSAAPTDGNVPGADEGASEPGSDGEPDSADTPDSAEGPGSAGTSGSAGGASPAGTPNPADTPGSAGGPGSAGTSGSAGEASPAGTPGSAGGANPAGTSGSAGESNPAAAPDFADGTNPAGTPNPATGSNPAGTSGGGQEPAVITFTIEDGYISSSICQALEEAGLVADAREFNNYILKHGKSRRILAGTYEIPLGTDEEEIARMITGNR